jgi:hypothetical protein
MVAVFLSAERLPIQRSHARRRRIIPGSTPPGKLHGRRVRPSSTATALGNWIRQLRSAYRMTAKQQIPQVAPKPLHNYVLWRRIGGIEEADGRQRP